MEPEIQVCCMLLVCYCLSTRGCSKHRLVLNLQFLNQSWASIKSFLSTRLAQLPRPQLCVSGQELLDSAWLWVKSPWRDEAQAPPLQLLAPPTMVGLVTQSLHQVGVLPPGHLRWWMGHLSQPPPPSFVSAIGSSAGFLSSLEGSLAPK